MTRSTALVVNIEVHGGEVGLAMGRWNVAVPVVRVAERLVRREHVGDA